MNTITLFLSDGQIFIKNESGTIPELQKKYAIGKKLTTSSGKKLGISALTIGKK